MALFGSFATVRAQLATNPSFEIAYAYLAECFTPGSAAYRRLQAVPLDATERVELGGGVFALEQAYHAKRRADGRWESHRAHIDIQVIVDGEEFMEFTDIASLKVAEDLTPAKDILFYERFDAGSIFRAPAGSVAVFFPVDAHMPSLSVATPSLVRKTVVKVPVVPPGTP